MIFKPRKSDGADARERALWGDLISLGTVFPIAIALGFFLGRWIGGKLGHPAAGQWIGLVWGIATAFWELYKTTKRMDRYDQLQARESEAREAEERRRPLGGEDGDGDGS